MGRDPPPLVSSAIVAYRIGLSPFDTGDEIASITVKVNAEPAKPMASTTITSTLPSLLFRQKRRISRKVDTCSTPCLMEGLVRFGVSPQFGLLRPNDSRVGGRKYVNFQYVNGLLQEALP
jgi:hypothetical protein